MSGAAQLRTVQDIDSRIEALRSDIERVQSALHVDRDLERAQAAVATGEQQRLDAEQAATTAEAELNALQRRVTNVDRKLYGGSVHNPNELVEMQHELETLRVRAADAEERALDLLEQAEGAAAEQKERVAALQREEQRRAEALQPLKTEFDELTRQLEAATADRDSVVSSLGRDALALYTRVAQRRTPAVVSLNGDTCGGCHLPLSNEERRLVRTGSGIVQCSNCDRILVP
ncbi:MAG: zinc ribbon domain-containing protein [Candidatus Dormibacteria bacterium]